MEPSNTKSELKKIYRFFKNQVPKYIFLVVDDQRLLNYLIIQVQVELKKQGKKILHLKLMEDNFSIFRQVEEFLKGNICNGLILSNVNTLIYRNEKDTLEKLNRSRDAFEKFGVPIIFILNNENLKKVIRGAADFYQLRDLPDFHFEGTTIEDREISDISIPQVERYADSDLKADLLEEQLKIIDKKKKIDKDSLNNIIMPLLKIYITRDDYNNMKTLFDRYVKGQEKNVEDKITLGNYYSRIYDYKKALFYLELGKENFEILGDKKRVAMCHNQIGNIYYSKGDYESALQQYEKSLEIRKKLGDISGVSASLHQIGMIYQDRGEYDKALQQYEKSLEISEKIGNISGVASSFNQVALIHIEKKNHPQALRYFIQAFVIFAKIGSPNVNSVKNNILKVKEKIPAKQFVRILKEFEIPENTFQKKEGL